MIRSFFGLLFLVYCGHLLASEAMVGTRVLSGAAPSAASMWPTSIVHPKGHIPQSSSLKQHIVEVTNFGADPTYKKDSVEAFNKALATGRDVHIMPGHYMIRAGWIDMTRPNQRLYCDNGSTVLTVKRGAVNPTPALVIEPEAIAAQFQGCTIDHDGGQFLSSGPYVPLIWNNKTTGTHANDGLGNAVLIMADHASFSGTVTRGWDNCIGIGRFNLSTGQQTPTPAPSEVTVTRTSTSYCGVGVHDWSPKFNQGAGIDVLTGSKAMVSDSIDQYSYDGFWIDTNGGASAIFTNLKAYYTRMTPDLPKKGDGWHETYSGIGFYLSGSNINFDGSTNASLAGSSCVNCVAIEPMTQGLRIDQHANGLTVTNFRAVRPGLECIWDQSGTTVFRGVVCDTPNNLRGEAAPRSGKPAPQTAAIQVDASDTADVVAQIRGTVAQFEGLTIENTGVNKPSYSFALALSDYGATPTMIVSNAKIQPGSIATYFRPAKKAILQLINLHIDPIVESVVP